MKKNFIICFFLFNLMSFSNQNFLIHKLETDFQNKIIKNKTDILNNSIHYNDVIFYLKSEKKIPFVKYQSLNKCKYVYLKDLNIIYAEDSLLDDRIIQMTFFIKTNQIFIEVKRNKHVIGFDKKLFENNIENFDKYNFAEIKKIKILELKKQLRENSFISNLKLLFQDSGIIGYGRFENFLETLKLTKRTNKVYNEAITVLLSPKTTDTTLNILVNGAFIGSFVNFKNMNLFKELNALLEEAIDIKYNNKATNLGYSIETFFIKVLCYKENSLLELEKKENELKRSIEIKEKYID